MDFSQYKKAHFIGIGGISMSSLVPFCFKHNIKVSGSDWNRSSLTDKLADDGAKIYIGHDACNISDDTDLVVYTAAVKDDNIELAEARRRGLKVMERAEFIGELMKQYKYSIAVSGCHGKTTTTAMIFQILYNGMKNPTLSFGGICESIHSNYYIGGDEFFVLEACEYHDSFLSFHPYLGIILNIDNDHLDYFGSMANIRRSYAKFAANVPADGVLIISSDIPDYQEICSGLSCRVVSFSAESNKADYSLSSISHRNGFMCFNIEKNGSSIVSLQLSVLGEHNAANALAACSACFELGLNADEIKAGIESFGGTQRRFQFKGAKNDTVVIDDYAHHPTEIRASLKAVKNAYNKRIVCVFQPHTYSRTIELMDGFADAFEAGLDKEDELILLDIYASREKGEEGVSSADLAEILIKRDVNVTYIKSFDDTVKYLQKKHINNSLLITMGAGDVYLVGELYLNA